MSTYKPQKPTFAFPSEEVDANSYAMSTSSTTPQNKGEVDKELLERLETEKSLRELSLGMPIDYTRDMLRKKGVNPVSTEYVKEAGARATKVREYFENADKPINEEGYIDLSQPTTNIAGFDKYVDNLITAGLAEEQTDAGGKRIGITLTSKGDIEPLIAGVFSSTPTPEAFSGRSQSDYFSQLTKEVISQLPVNENGEIEYDGVPYQWAELYDAFYPVVAERVHNSLLDNNKDYYNWAFEQSMGMSYEDWYKGYANQRVSEIEQKIIELRDAVAEEAAQIAEGRGREVALSSGTLVPASVLGWASKEGARIEASKQFNDVLESINTFRNNGFVAGFDEGFDWVDVLSFGLADLGTSYSQLQLLEKAKRGEELSNSESKVLELLQLTQEFEGIKKSLGWEKSLGSLVGSGLGTTLSMAPSFAAGMAATSRIGTTVKLLSNVAKNTSKKAAVKQIGKNLITSYARGAAVAPFMPSTYTTGLKELQEQYTFNADGSIKFEPTNKALAFLGGYIDTMNEYASEVFGSTLGEILGYGARAFGRVTRLNKAVDAVMGPINAGLGKAIDKALSYLPIEDAAKLAGVRKALRGVIVPSAELDEETKELMRLWGVQDGYVAEAGSEIFGDLMSQVMRDVVGAKTDYSDFKDSNYWASQLLVAVLYGGSMNALGHIKEGVSDYQQMVDLGKYNKQLLDKIESKELRNKVLALTADGSIDEMSAQLADIKWEEYHPTDRAKVMDYVRNEMMIQTIAGKVEDGGRVDAFAKEVAKLSGVTYQGKGGLIMETTVGGRQYYIVDGKPADRSESSMLTCIDKETGEKKAILANTLPEQPSIRTFNEVAEQMYVSQFSAQAEATRLSSLQSAYDQMERPTAEVARDIMSRMGITPPAEGEVITLADGRKARVTQDLENGEYVVRLEDKVPLLFTVPFYSIRSSNPLTAEAQKLMIEGKVGSAANKASDVAAMEVENGDVTEETMAQPTDGVTPAEASEAEAQTAEAMAQTEEQVANDTLDMTNVPTDADGDVDYDAIDDSVQYAQVYAHEVGNKAQARVEVEELKQKTLESAAKLEEQAKNEITALAKRKKLKEAKKLRERAAFYDKVLPEFEEMEEEYTSVVKNEYSQQVAEPTLRVLDAMAKKLGLKVRFVDEVRTASGGKANANINGNEVEIAFMERVKSIAFLMGHEFTHRMQELSPEQYAEFKQMVKDFVGEEAWNNESNRLKAIYAIQGVAIEDAELEDEITADMAGALVEQRDAFLDFLEGKKDDKTFLGKVMDFLKEMAAIFNGANDNDREKQVLSLIDGVNRLIESAERANAQGIKPTSAETSARHSIIGEVGATALDMAEEATFRIDNLAIARQMEERGDSALDIRMATGWERGADGLWRYEVMDAEVNLYDGNEATIRKKIKVAEEEEQDFMQQSKADTKELRERTNTYLAEMREKYGVAEGEETDAMTEEEIAHLQSLTGKEIAFEDYKERRRNELYNRRMALEAQLGYVIVKNTNSDAMIISTRLSHILQGKNADALFTAYPSLRDMEVQFVTDIRDGAFAAYATEGGYKRIELNAKKTPADMLTYYLMHEVQHAIQDVEGFAGGGNLSSLQNNGEVTAKEAYDYYRKIAGEVEARNVSARLDMSAEERRATLLSETEDVAREDQIFLRDGVEMAMAEEQQDKRYSLSEETIKIFDAAKSKFGTTYDMREAGYILPDGSMLDFSGRHQVEGDASFLNGDRTVDHREISDIAYDADDNETGINTDLGDFLDRGAIRIDSNAGAINLNVAPTKAQKERLKRLIERNDGYVYVDFGKGWDTEHYAEYEAARASRVLGDIERYFDEGIKPAGNVRFSLQETNDRFNAELDAFKTGQNIRELHLGIPSPLLRACGVSASEIFITAKTLRDHLKKHNLTEDEIKNLPIAINDPIMVYEWGEKAKSKIIITQIPRGEQRITVAIKMERGGKRLSVNELASVHGKDVERLMNEMLTTKSDFGKDNLKYVNKEIAMQWLGIAPPEGAASLTDAQQSIANIIQNFQNPKIEARYSLITPEMDAAYLSAVERGDMATAQQMVMEAAKLAMPNTKVVDENGNPKVMYHGDRKKSRYIFSTDTFFTPDATYAKRYTNSTGEVYATYLDIQKPFDIRDKKAYDIFVEFRGGRTPAATASGAMDWAEYSYEDLQEFVEEYAPNEYDGFIMDEGADPDGNGGIKHRGLSYVPFASNQIKSADPVTYDDAGNVIPLSERFNPEKEDIRYSLMEPTNEEATFDNFFTNTSATFKPISVAEKPTREPDYVSKRWDGFGASSRYWYGEDERGKYVIRESDHWSNVMFTDNSVAAFEKDPYNRRYTRIATCQWAIDATELTAGKTESEGGKKYNEVISEFRGKYDDNGRIYAKAYLDDFTKWRAKGSVRYSLTAYNGDIERILSDSKAIAKTYAISSDVIVAKSEQDYMTALLAYGVPEDKIYSDTDAVYLDWEDVIVVNAQGINTPIRLTEVLNHENMHSISRQDKESITKVAGTLPILKVVEYASNELSYSLDYIKKHFADIPLEVVDEILSTFVESISTMPVVGGGYVLRRYLMGNLTIEDALEASKQIIKEKYGSKYSELTAATMPLLQDNLIKLRDERYKERKVGNTTLWSEGAASNREGFAETGRSEEESRTESQTAQRDGRTEAESAGGEGGEVGKFSINTDMTEEDAYKAYLLEEAMRMEREATSNGMDIAQEIADATGWVRLANGEWKYYGEGKLDITDKASAERAAFRWLESKKAVKIAQVRKIYEPLIKAAKASVVEVGRSKKTDYAKLKRYADKVEYILQGTPVESLPIEDQILVDIVLGQRLKWNDGDGKRGLKSELGLRSAKNERMGAVTLAARDYVEDYIERLMERNNGYEQSLDDNDIRNAIIEVFAAYPSPKAALDELYSRYKPTAEVDQAEEALARLEYERDAALAQIDAEYKDIYEDFDNNPDRYVREHQEAESYNADLDMYVGSLGKARKEVERMEREAKKRKLSDEEKMAAMRAAKSAIAKELRDGLGRFTRKYDIQRMMDAVNDARTPYAMLKAIDKAMESLFEIKWRREYARMQMLTKSKISYGVTAIDASSFLNTFVSDHKITAADARKIMNDYWRGTKANGVSVAKYIDDTTRQVMEFISEMAEYDKARARFSDIKATEIIAFTRKLREKLEDYTSLNDYKLKTALANDAVRNAVIGAVDILEMYWKAQELQLSLNDDKHRRDISALEIKAKEITAQLREVNQQIKDLADGKVVVTSSGVKDRDLLRKELQERYNTLLAERAEAYADMYNAMPDIINLMQEANRAVETLLRTGKVNLAIERTKRKEHEKEIIDDVLADLASPASAHKHEIDLRDKSVFERIATGVGSKIGAPLGSMDYMLRAIGRNAPLGEGRTYNRFAYAFQKAYDNIYTALEARKKMLDDKCNILWGENYHEVHKMAESTKVMTHTYSSAINTKDGGWKPVENTTDIYVTQAMYILATWNQAEGRVTLERQGFTDESINAIRDALNRIDPRWIEFADWVVEEYLPSGREKYNAVHRDIFGTSMAAVPNYFPIKRAKEKLQKEEDVAKGDVDLLPSTVVGAIKERTSNVVPIDIETSFFEALNENTSVMEAWAEMVGLIQDINTILSNGAVQKTMLDINSSLFSDFKKAAQVATLSYIGKTPDIDKNLGTILNRLWAGSKIAFRLNTAFKQLSSALLFAGYSADPKFQAILLWRYLGGVGKMPVALMNGIIDGASYLSGHSFANIDIMTNIEWAKKNMPSFAKRWNEGVAGNELMARTTSGNTSWKQRAWYVKFDDAVRAVTKFGMKPNAFIDAFTSAAGARAVYDYTYEEMRKEGYSEEEAHTLAIINAEMTFNTTQQSSEGLYLSPMQMDRSVFKTALSTFMNAPYAMFRNTMIGVKEIFRDAKKELAEIERLEFKRAMDIAKKQVEAQVAAAVARGEYSEEEAKKRRDELFDSAKAKIMPLVKDRAYNKYVKAQTKAVVMVFLNGYAGTAAFALMGRLPELLFGDDDEEKKKAVYDIVVHSAWEAPLSMIPIGGNIISLGKGYDASLLPAVDELFKEGSTIIKGLREEGISPEVIYTATKMCMRLGLGLNVDTIANIALGLENMIEDGMSPEAILKVMNAPERQIRSIVGQRREGETAKEYSERVMRFYSILDTPIYEDYFNVMGDDIGERKNDDTPRGMSNKEMKRISFEDAYRRNVILRYGGGKQLAEMQETRKAYNKLKREGYGNIIGSPRDYLKNLTTKRNKAEAALIRFVGADAAYYDMLQVVDEYEKLYIELYEQFKQ